MKPKNVHLPLSDLDIGGRIATKFKGELVNELFLKLPALSYEPDIQRKEKFKKAALYNDLVSFGKVIKALCRAFIT